LYKSTFFSFEYNNEIYPIIKDHQNDSLISFVKHYQNEYYIIGNNPICYVFEGILSALAVATFVYGVYIFKQTAKTREAAFILQAIIFLCCFIVLLDSFILITIDPNYSRLIFDNSIYIFLSINPTPLTIISTLVISLIWSKVLEKDLNIDAKIWVKNLILIVAIVSAILYPAMIIVFLLLYTDSYPFYTIVVFYFLTVIFIMIFYTVNLIRILIKFQTMMHHKKRKKYHIDKFIVIINYILLLICFGINASYYTATEFIITTFLLHFSYIMNCILCFYFFRAKKNYPTSRSLNKSKSKSKNTDKDNQV